MVSFYWFLFNELENVIVRKMISDIGLVNSEGGMPTRRWFWPNLIISMLSYVSQIAFTVISVLLWTSLRTITFISWTFLLIEHPLTFPGKIQTLVSMSLAHI